LARGAANAGNVSPSSVNFFSTVPAIGFSDLVWWI
jgi:hypothetical protein